MEIQQLHAVHNFLESSARLHPEKIALIHEENRVTYAELNRLANRVARFLLDHGVNEGDRVVLLLENGLEYIVTYYAVLKARGVAVPLNSETRSDALSALLAELHPKVLVAGSKNEKLLQDLRPEQFKIPLMLIKDPGRSGDSSARVAAWDEVAGSGDAHNLDLLVDPTSLASIIYTSGSTGKPKGVMLSHRNIVANTASIVQYLKLAEQDIQMVVLPFFYVMGKSLLNTHFAVGGTVVINNNFAYPASVIKQMEEEKVTGFSGVPATYAYLLHRSPLSAFRDRLDSLRYCTQAGGHMSRQIKEKLIETLPPHTKLFVMYGATEAAARLTYVEPERLAAKIDSIGRPIPGVTMKVLDEKGNEVPLGETGELVASGANIMQGYWMDPGATARALSEHGYHTGDLGYIDEDGYLYVIGRKDDLLKVGGHRVDPQEVEDALMATGALLEVAVLGVADELLGKKLVALAVPLREDQTANSILALCLDKLPRHKLPAEIRFVRALPKYASSKIDRPGCLVLFNAASDQPAIKGR
jgi:long-chain acyl-CoA synthetase